MIPEDARELARWKLPKNAGLHFAMLTGDINPIHWVGPYARMAGFKGVILHGFATLARAIESMNAGLWGGDVTRLSSIEVRFVRPVNLPGEYGVYVNDAGSIWVGKSAGQEACLVGDYTTREG
jgi:acyl dehydratase